MSKNFLNDIRPSGRGNSHDRIDDDEIVEKKGKSVQLPPRFKEKSFEPANFRPRSSRKIMWIVVIFVIIGAVISIASYYTSAKVNIIQKSSEVSLENSAFNATLAGDEKNLSFKLVKLSGSAEKIVTGGTPTTVNTKATGKVIIYNNYSSAPQKLAIDTRLATDDGKIYKTDIALTVPGTKTEAGKTVPGSIEVGVHADEAGPTYNLGLSDFTIVGFKGTSKYDKFYARSKTAMTGGASGQGLVLSDADQKVAHEAAMAMLKSKLISEAKASLPESTVLLKNSYIIREDPDSGQTVADKNVLIVKGEMFGIIFNELELSQKIASTAINNFDNAPVKIPKLDEFVVEIKNPETIVDTTSTISVSISGKGKALWQIPEDKILEALTSAKKKEVNTLLADFPSVEKASVKIRPFWSLKLPSKSESIQIVVGIENPSQ